MDTTSDTDRVTIATVHQDALVEIFGYLSPYELCNICSLVCKAWHSLYGHHVLWREHLRRTWLVETVGAPLTLHDAEGPMREFKEMQVRWAGGYGKCYARVRRAWMRVEQFLDEWGSKILLKQGCEKLVLEQCEQVANTEMPLEFKCAYRIHNGQDQVSKFNNQELCYFGLFGGYSFYDYRANAFMFPLEQSCKYMLRYMETARDSWLKKVIVVAGSGRLLICLVLHNFSEQGHSFVRGQIVQKTAQGPPMVLCDSFIEWFEQYSIDLSKRKYEVLGSGEICRFPRSTSLGSDVTTRGVRIRASALLIPENSVIMPPEPKYFWAYRIIISMDANEAARNSCQLVSRHWQITDTTGKMEEVRGPGVIGEYPVMKPGAYFEYRSCTYLNTPHGSMKGSFQFTVHQTGEMFDAVVGEFPLHSSVHL